MRSTWLPALSLVFASACVTEIDTNGKDEEAQPLDGKADALALTPEGILQPTNTRTLLVGEAQGYTFYGAPGAKVTLTMVAAKPGCGRSSTKLDPYLYVWDQNGKTIASNDDAGVGGGACNAQIASLSLPNGGPFAVVATSWAQGSGGQYTLTYTCDGCTGAGATGSFSDQSLTVGGEDRRYWLHVPPQYTGSAPYPLIVDFHGTASVPAGNTTAHPEEYYALGELVTVADREGFIVVRPRSRALAQNGASLYQWDANAGDLPKNVAFTRALVTALEGRYRIDPARVYVFGFSNGTNMAMQFLADQPALFHGYGAVGGGIWNEVARGAFAADAPRMYLATGFRDYMYQWFQRLYLYLGAHDYPFAGKIFVRFTDASHEIYGWHYGETFAWVDRGQRPAEGALGAAWTDEATLPGTDGLAHLARAANGDVIAVGSSGTIYRRAAATGVWTLAAQLGNDDGLLPPFTGVCMLPSGRGLAVAGGLVATTGDHGATWQREAAVPEFQPMGFGYSYLTSVACTGDGRVVGTGYWAAASSSDEGRTWKAGGMDNGGYPAQGAHVAVSPGGTWIAVGYYAYLGRSVDGVSFSKRALPAQPQWLSGAAPAAGGRWWTAGEAGTIFASTDDGQSWTAQTSPRRDDLYAVSFVDASTGLTVGAHGAALSTSDGGAHWQDRSLGQDVSLDDVLWLDDGSALVAGTRGKIYRFRGH